MTREPTWSDWINAVPLERRDHFARHLEAGRERMVRAWEERSNIHGRGECPCMRHNESRDPVQPRGPRVERLWEEPAT